MAKRAKAAVAGGASMLEGTSGTKVADVTVWPFTMHQVQVIGTAIGALGADNVLVRLRTDDGVVGWGESSPFTPVMGETQASDLALAKDLAKIVKGRDPFMIAKIVQDMDRFVPGNPGIKAAFEMALWDIAGKICGQPVYKMLGGFRDSFVTDKTVYLDTPDVMAKKAKGIIELGYTVVKVKLGQAPEYDIERLQAVRKAVGPKIQLSIDANQGWTATTAVHALKGLAEFNVEFCEQPVPYWDWEGMKFVRERSPIPITADESVHSPHDAIEAVRRGACDMINIKIMKSGGILNGMRIAQIGEAAGLPCMLGCMSEIKIAITAAAHVACASPSVTHTDLDSITDYDSDPILGGVELNKGIMTVSQKPGLGLDVDPAWLSELRAV